MKYRKGINNIIHNALLKNSTSSMLLFILLINLLLFIFKGYDELCCNIVETISCIITGSLAITTLMKNNKIRKSMIAYIGINCIFLCLLTFYKIIIMQVYNFPLKNVSVLEVTLLIIIFENTGIIIAIHYHNLKANLLECIKKIFIGYFLFLLNFIIFDTDITYLLFFTIALSIYTWVNILYLYSKVKDKQLINLVYSFCFYSSQIANIIFIISVILNKNLMFLFENLRCFSYLFYYHVFENVILKEAYSEVKDKLLSIEKNNRSMNSRLKDKNKILSEVSSLIEHSNLKYKKLIYSIRDGIAIYKDNNITFMNDNLKKNIEINKKDNVKLMNQIINKARSIENNNSDIVNLGTIEIYNRSIDMYYVDIGNKEEILYFKDISEIIKENEQRQKYLEFLSQEKIKNEFYANISHEIRTPITLIYSALQLNDIYIKNKNIQGMKKNEKVIKQNCLRLIRTISNFIDANKISEGYLIPEFNIYNIVSIIENVSMACNKYIESVNNNMIFDTVEEEIFVKCDKEMLERIMMNLLSNIVKYGKKDGTIYINIDIKSKNVIIIVRIDNYTISDEYKKLMFKKFSKLNNKFNRDKEGSGLGLYLVKQLLLLNGGTISVETNMQSGTSFIMSIPIYENAQNIIEQNEDEYITSKYLDEKVDTEFSDIYL